MANRATVIKKMKFEAAHFLPKSNYTGSCNNVHGHSYCVFVSIYKDINPKTGMVIDFKIIKDAMKSCLDKLDHNLLNTYIQNPTAENIILWIWEQLLKFKEMHEISSIELWETENCHCIIKKEDIDKKILNKWKRNYYID